MMADLITITDLQAVCGLNKAVEVRKVAAWIKEAHVRFEKHLGRALYALLQAAPTDQRFVDLMAEGKGWGKDYLCWCALALAYPSLYAEADRGGVLIRNGEEYSSVDSRTLGMLKATAEGSMESRQDFLLSYLKDNVSVYPEWRTITGSEDRITESNTRGVAGISFRRSAKQNTYRG